MLSPGVVILLAATASAELEVTPSRVQVKPGGDLTINPGGILIIGENPEDAGTVPSPSTLSPPAAHSWLGLPVDNATLHEYPYVATLRTASSVDHSGQILLDQCATQVFGGPGEASASGHGDTKTWRPRGLDATVYPIRISCLLTTKLVGGSALIEAGYIGHGANKACYLNEPRYVVWYGDAWVNENDVPALATYSGHNPGSTSADRPKGCLVVEWEPPADAVAWAAGLDWMGIAIAADTFTGISQASARDGRLYTTLTPSNWVWASYQSG